MCCQGGGRRSQCCCRPTVAQALSVHVHTKRNIYRNYESVIVSYPRTVAPLNRIRPNKGHVNRRVYELVMCVYEVYAKKETLSFLK